MHEGITFPNGVRFSPDQAFLIVDDSAGRWVWSFLVQPDGSLADGVPFTASEIPDEVESGVLRSGADGMAVDTDGFIYVATNLGIQICDPIGRTVGILNKPHSRRIHRTSSSAGLICRRCMSRRVTKFFAAGSSARGPFPGRW